MGSVAPAASQTASPSAPHANEAGGEDNVTVIVAGYAAAA